MTAPFTVELDTSPGRRQGEERFTLQLDGETREVVLHDYATVYSVPGLYEEVVQRRLQCASPATVADALVEAGTSLGIAPGDLRAFDLGAGNGVVGEEMAARGVTVVVGADGIPEARDAADRDRPGMYAHYLVGERLDGAEVADLVRDERLTALVAAGAVGEGHVPVDALAELWSTFPSGSVIALTLKDGGPETGDHDVPDVEAMIAGLDDTDVVVRRRFRHRFSMAGAELYYLVLAAVKR
ncbi:methyltransferase [Actinomycetospora endophytica]|uniref:Methyltransferase n=1 Tax=Actinomycetospora endophytica TaxID=2291215 RepID=A0ABS8P8Q2_9PSEU|nr:methyltransferase [Actinomycetospora endophytica]MCD2193895.1 methyltransferase [Actinomycetospora endophytica]